MMNLRQGISYKSWIICSNWFLVFRRL